MVLSQARKPSNVVLRYDKLQNAFAAALRNPTIAALTHVDQAANATMRDMLGHPLVYHAGSGGYTLLQAGGEAAVTHVLIDGPRSQLLDPTDSADQIAATSLGRREWLVINLADVILAENWAPTEDFEGGALDAAALKTAVEALGARVMEESDTTLRQST